MKIPTIRGYHKGMDLYVQHSLASAAVNTALECYRKTTPVPEDYASQDKFSGSGVALADAWEEFRSRFERLESVEAELDQIAEGISKQLDGEKT